MCKEKAYLIVTNIVINTFCILILKITQSWKWASPFEFVLQNQGPFTNNFEKNIKNRVPWIFKLYANDKAND